ncbi:hypothetical protein ACFUGD_22410 [Streptomyces sp. NPDC057217]|uniref:hypothetical protein n=1 Tax=Streptomyces sp. NPDC057217 TaxID=3346054 RepID=UPI00362A96B8
MEWGTLAATLGGGLIAIAGTVLADRLRTRQEHRRGIRERRREVYTEFIAAAGVAHTELRRLAQSGAGTAGLEEASFGWSAWDGRERCPHCAEGGAGGAGALPRGRVPEGGLSEGRLSEGRAPLPGRARRDDVP